MGAKNRKLRYALSMKPFKPQILLILLSSLVLIACDRDSYTTWNCLSSAGSKSTMVTKKAQMQFQDQQFDYCGSLGERSFFSKTCPANIQDSDFVFTPASGVLHSNTQDYQCSAL
jgi:hypothetical protein